MAATTRTRRRPAAETREHVLDAAQELFYWQGIRATGVDTIARAAGVAPTTLYRLFASKDDMVAAYVERAAGRYRSWFADRAAGGRPDPRARMLAVFDGLAEQVQPEHCRGCPFLIALSETPDESALAHAHAVELKAWVRERFEAMAAEFAAADPALVADQLALVMEGTYASVQALGVEGPARRARRLAEQILDSADHAPRRAG